MKIPQKLHFVWLGSSMPPLFRRLIDIAASLHKTWEVKLWGENAVKRLIGEMGTGLDSLITADRLSFSTRSDIARYHIIAHEGGFYFDTDFVFLRELTPLTEWSFVGFSQADGLVATAAFGAT